MSAVTAFKSNIEVTVVDINSDRIAAWQSECLPIYEPGLHEIVKATRDGDVVALVALDSQLVAQGKRGFIDGAASEVGSVRQPNLFFSTDVDEAIENADLIFVCVNTPTKLNGVSKGTAVDLSFVEAATRNIARVAKESKIVVEKSTVPCKTAQSIREIVSFHRCGRFKQYNARCSLLKVVFSFLPMRGLEYASMSCLIPNFLPKEVQYKICFILTESSLVLCLH